MYKKELISIPQPLVMTNPYGLSVLETVNTEYVPYTESLVLEDGQYTYNVDIDAYEFQTGVNILSPTQTRGYLRLRDDFLKIFAGDEIEIEFEARSDDEIPNTQNAGVTLDLLTESGTLLTSLYYRITNATDNFKLFKSTQIVPPNLNTASKFNVIIGVTGSPLERYKFAIRNIKINIKHAQPGLSNKVIDKYGLGVSNFADRALIDHSTLYPSSQSRDITLKSGFYGLKNAANSGGDNRLRGNGTLLVLPYRADGSGNTFIEHIAFINTSDGNGIYKRGYDGSTSNWSEWQSISYGLGETDLIRRALIDNASTHPTSGSRDITLKSGFYGLYGTTDNNGDGTIGNGTLLVLPYRTTTEGIKFIEQIAFINTVTDSSGIYKRGYNGNTNSWSEWLKVGATTRFVSVPTSATATGKKGDFSADANYLYVCHNANQWIRIAKDTW